MNETLGLVLFFILFVVGIILQAGIFMDKPKAKPVGEIPVDQTVKKAD
jgi:hypothetical protein